MMISISALTICAPLFCFDCDWPVQMNGDGHSFACLNPITSANGVVEWTRSAIYQMRGSVQLPEVIISYVSFIEDVFADHVWNLSEESFLFSLGTHGFLRSICKQFFHLNVGFYYLSLWIELLIIYGEISSPFSGALAARDILTSVSDIHLL